MAHFARLNDDNVVTQVIVVNNEVLTDNDGVEQEALGIQFCQELLGGVWVQTSYNNTFRRQFAAVGSTYDSAANVFVSPKPFPSWSLDENPDWQPPIPPPEDQMAQWNESTLQWDIHDADPEEDQLALNN